ncbi:MAG: DUF4956 domain-containing protein [Firmicutes bacterium]|nr:DUF4956 domain-containing protein [Bacillota bacterium]
MERNYTMDTLFQSIMTGTLTVQSFMISLAVALVLGAIMALALSFKARHSTGFLISIATLPAIVAVIIMMVNGSLGASVAVAGAFSLVRFRSNPGTAREISAVFLAMAVGLACGIGYPGFATLFAIIIMIALLVYDKIPALNGRNGSLARTLRVTVPEDLDYTGVFDDIFNAYTSDIRLTGIKTTNLGSLNKLTYDVTLKEAGSEKKMIDEIRTRNGNLEISVSLPSMESAL